MRQSPCELFVVKLRTWLWWSSRILILSWHSIPVRKYKVHNIQSFLVWGKKKLNINKLNFSVIYNIVVILADSLKTNLRKSCRNHLSQKELKAAGFLSTISSRITPTKEKGKEKRNEQGWRKEENLVSFYSLFKFGFWTETKLFEKRGFLQVTFSEFLPRGSSFPVVPVYGLFL